MHCLHLWKKCLIKHCSWFFSKTILYFPSIPFHLHIVCCKHDKIFHIMDSITCIKDINLKFTRSKIHEMPEISFTEMGPSTGLSIKWGPITSDLSTSLIISMDNLSVIHSSSEKKKAGIASAFLLTIPAFDQRPVRESNPQLALRSSLESLLSLSK